MYLKLYMVTLIEMIIFIFIGFFGAHYGMSLVYEHFGIAYMGNVGKVSFGLAFFLFCLFTIVRAFIFNRKTALLKERTTSYTFWIVFLLSITFLLLPFVTKSI